MLQNHAKIRPPCTFLKHGLEVELLGETCKRGVILQHRCLVTLIVHCIFAKFINTQSLNYAHELLTGPWVVRHLQKFKPLFGVILMVTRSHVLVNVCPFLWTVEVILSTTSLKSIKDSLNHQGKCCCFIEY